MDPEFGMNEEEGACCRHMDMRVLSPAPFRVENAV